MIEPPQQGLKSGGGEIIGGGQAQHGQQPDRVDSGRPQPAGVDEADGQTQQHAAADQCKGQAGQMDDQIGELFSAVAVVGGRQTHEQTP